MSSVRAHSLKALQYHPLEVSGLRGGRIRIRPEMHRGQQLHQSVEPVTPGVSENCGHREHVKSGEDEGPKEHIPLTEQRLLEVATRWWQEEQFTEVRAMLLCHCNASGRCWRPQSDFRELAIDK
jgi:hypothetical protein